MKFRTEIEPVRGWRGLIDHRRPVVMLGSCFTDNIGRRLSDALFDVVSNPLGTLYNPLSIAATMRLIASGEGPGTETLVRSGSVWHSWMCHSSLSSPDPGTLLTKAAEATAEAHRAMEQASAVVITLGSSRVFTLKADGRVAANCHRQPASMFTERYIDVDEATEALRKSVASVRSVNPSAKVIFTVSPIRHKGDSLHASQLSKATLLLAVDRTIKELPDTLYFPSYEIMMDDLRDYRFYDADMVHPSGVAVEYIYTVFAETFFAEATADLARRCEKLTRRLSHRFMTDDRESRERFTSETQSLTETLIEAYPYLEPAISKFVKK